MSVDLSTYIGRQMEGIRGLLGSLLADVTPEEWVVAPGPGLNPIGFTAWHVASIQDWAIHTWMQNAPTIRSRAEWEAKGMMTSFLPFGMSLAATFDVARATRPEDIVAYADAVLEAARGFVATLTPEQLDLLPPNRDHLVDPRYNQQAYLAEIDDMYEQPLWRVFAGACTGHCRGHLGELELALTMLRSS